MFLVRKLVSSIMFVSNSVVLLSDDYRLTAAINIVKWVVSRYEFQNESNIKEEAIASRKNDPAPSQPPKSARKRSSSRGAVSRASSRVSASSRGSATVLPVRVLTLSLEACRQFINSQEHLDIDPDPNRVRYSLAYLSR